MNCAHTAADSRGRRGRGGGTGDGMEPINRTDNACKCCKDAAACCGHFGLQHPLPFVISPFLSLSRTLTDRQTTLIDYLNVCGAIVVPLSVQSSFPSPSPSPAHSRFPIPQRFTQQSSTDCPRTPPSPAHPHPACLTRHSRSHVHLCVLHTVAFIVYRLYLKFYGIGAWINIDSMCGISLGSLLFILSLFLSLSRSQLLTRQGWAGAICQELYWAKLIKLAPKFVIIANNWQEGENERQAEKERQTERMREWHKEKKKMKGIKGRKSHANVTQKHKVIKSRENLSFNELFKFWLK